MGGQGSGWQRTRKLTVEEGLILDVKDLVAKGVLDPGWRNGSLRWQSSAALQYSSSISQNGTGTLWLRYTADGEFMYYTVTLVSTVPHYGGRHWWFICPVKKIRVSKLHLPPGATQFASRKAHNLTYRSSRECGWRKRSQKFRRRMAQRLAGSR
jgi:hypothetical protein